MTVIQRQLSQMLVGTNNLKKTISTEKFLRAIAFGVKTRDPGFLTIEETYDFTLTIAAKSYCWGKGEPLTPAQRVEFLKIIEEDVLTCFWTSRRVHFFVSFMMEMFSPDRTQFFKTTKKGRTVYEAYLYSHPLQKTVRSSYYAQCWMNDEPFRDALLHRHCRNFVTAENNLDFATLFGKADAGIKKFNDVPLKDRPIVFKNENTNVPEAQLKTIFGGMQRPNRDSRVKKEKPLVCDFKNFQELVGYLAVKIQFQP